MDIIVSKKKIVTYSVIAITILIGLIGGATYAFFQANVSATNTVTVNANTASGSYSFTSYSDGDLTLELGAGNMIDSSEIVNNTVSQVNATKNLFVNLTVPSGSNVQCSYKVTWSWKSGSDTYLNATANVLTDEHPYQYTVEVKKYAGNGSTYTTPLIESDLSFMTWTSNKTTLYTGITSSSDGASVVDRYEVTARMYNLPVNQPDLLGKSFRGSVTVESVDCEFTSEAEVAGTPSSFKTDNWATIQKAVQDNNLSAYNVGDTKCISLNSSEDSSINSTTNASCDCTNGQYCVRIANKSSCSSTNMTGVNKSQTACGLVIEFYDVITFHKMNLQTCSTSGCDGYYGTNAGGWPASSMRDYVNSTIFDALPISLKGRILSTYTVTGHGKSDTTGNLTNYNFGKNEQIYLFSPTELYGSKQTYDTAGDLTRQLDIYESDGVTTGNYASLIRQHNNSNSYHWFRTANSYTTNFFYNVYAEGSITSNYAIGAHGVLPAFRIG